MAPRIEGPGSRCEVRPGAPGLIRAAPEPLAPRKSRVKPQLRLPLQRPPSYRREDLVVSRANAAAVAVLDAWPAWPAGAVALVGPAGCGKTHLVNIWAERSGAARLQPGALPGQLDALRGRPVVVEAADEADGVACERPRSEVAIERLGRSRDRGARRCHSSGRSSQILPGTEYAARRRRLRVPRSQNGKVCSCSLGPRGEIG